MQTEKILSEKKEIVVCFSGFPDDVKKQLAESVYSLYGKVKWDVGIDADITHVVTKPSCRTMKTLAAGITCKWLVSLDWIIDSARAGYFLPEIGYGIRNSEWLFQKKKFFISPKFKAKYKKYRMRCCYTLIKLGGGQLVNSTKHADYVLVTTKESCSPHWLLTANPNTKTEILVWGTFINLIAPKEIVRSPSPLIEKCLQVVSQNPSQIGADKIRSRLSLDLKEKILEYLAETQTLNPRNMEFFLDSRLTELNLQECIVTQASLDSIKICDNLRSLDISGIKAEEDISELALIKLIQKLPNLSCLKMNKWRITDMMLSRLAKKENLTHLEISQCNRLSAGAILDFINEVQNLRSFALADIPIVNDKVVCALADKCGENLIALDISKNEGISDLSVMKLASKCPNLIELKVKRTAVSFNAILLLIESCPNLKHLDIYNCKDFVPKALRQLKDKFPYLKLTHTKFIKTPLNFIGGNGSEDSL
jgi:hypothetical protein